MNRKLLIIASVVAVLTALTFAPAYAAGIVVNTNADVTIAGDGFCTLREAITNANSDSDTTGGDCPAGSGADAITFAAGYTITLVNQLPAVTTEMTITGNGATNTIIQANAAPKTASYRVFEVSGGGNLTLDSLTVRNGYCGGLCATQVASGGGIYNYAGTLTVSNVTFSGNSASVGGGVYTSFGSPTLTNVTFSGNSARHFGGGMYNDSSSPALTNVTFSGNSALVYGGGGMYNDRSSPALTNVTFGSNSAFDGGGMYNNDRSSPTLTNVTFSGNFAYNVGGGMYNVAASSPTLTNVTFSANSA